MPPICPLSALCPGHIAAPNDFGTFTVRFSPDGTLLASGGVDSTVKIWRVFDGALIQTLSIGDEFSPNVFTVSFSPDGQFVAAGTDALRRIKVWRVSDWTLFFARSALGPKFSAMAKAISLGHRIAFI